MFGAQSHPAVARPLDTGSLGTVMQNDASSGPARSSEPRSERSSERLLRLQRTIQNEIIPRLLVSHRAGPVPPSLAIAVARQLSDVDVRQFLALVRGIDDTGSAEFVQELMQSGISIESVYLDLLAPAARRLGTLWESDECDFVEVTVAMGRMQRTLRDLSHVFLADASRTETAGSVLLSCVPGEQHTLGVIMVGEFLLRDGWRVLVGSPWTDSDIDQMIGAEWYDVVGFSVGCESHVSALKREIRRMRAASRNPNVKVIVGGRIFADNPDMIGRVGADAYASDARGAPQVARSLRDGARDGTSSATTAAPVRESNTGHGEFREAARRE